MKNKEIKVIFESEGKEDYLNLNKVVSDEISRGIKSSFNITILRSIEQKVELLKLNPEVGRCVKKNLIPKDYIDKGITNLWILNLSNYWRLLYTIKTNEIYIICVLLEFGDHNKYNQIFGFKKK
ncbi:MAG: hypothetical protein V1824_03455 [archaeon]